MASIGAYMPDDGPKIFYDHDFRRMLEDHMHYLRSHSTTDSIDVDGHVANKHHGDLVGVLTHYEIPLHMHWLVMRMNRFTSPLQYTSSDLNLIVPSQTVIGTLMKRFRANQKISSKS